MTFRHFDGLTGLRGILSMWVVVAHCLNNSGYRAAEMPWYAKWLLQPHYAVEGFMILSGLVIAHLIVTKREPYGLYIWRRWLRLFPLLFVCVMAVLLITWISPRTFPHVARNVDLIPQHLSSTLLMIHGLVPNEWLKNASTGILAPAWSTSLEWQFYLVAPLLVWPLLTRRYWLLAVLLIVSIPLHRSNYWIFGQLYSWGHFAFLPNSLVFFAAGIAAYAGANTSAGRRVMAVIDAGFSNRYLVWLGTVSFSIYLTHIIVLHSVRVGIVERYFTRQDWEWLPLLMVLTIAGALFVSAFTYRYVEEPFIRWGKRRKPASNGSPASSDAAIASGRAAE